MPKFYDFKVVGYYLYFTSFWAIKMRPTSNINQAGMWHRLVSFDDEVQFR